MSLPLGLGRSLLMLGAGALLAPALSGCHRAAPEEENPAPTVKVRTVKLESLRDAIVAPGTVVPAPAADWVIVAPEAAQVVELPKAEGAVVKAGDLLVRFAFTASADDVARRQSEVQEATTQLDAAKAELAKQNSMFARGYAAKVNVDAAAAAVTAAGSAVTHAQALLKAATALGDRAVVRAPFAGLVTERWHNEGDFVAATPDDPVLRVVDPTRVQIAVHISPGQLVRVTPGQEATVTDVGSGGPMPATVVSRPLVSDQAVTSVEIRLALTPGAIAMPAGGAGGTPAPGAVAPAGAAPGAPGAPTPAQIGASPAAMALALQSVVQAEILLGQRTGVVAVPTSAIQRAEGTSFVMIAGTDGRAHRHDVRIGLSTRELTEILSGVAVGDDVIINNLDQINDNAVIVIER